jgi:hypothetical protein
MTDDWKEPNGSANAEGAGRRRAPVLVAVASLVVIAAAVALVVSGRIDLTGGGSTVDAGSIGAAGAGRGEDPFAYSADRESELESDAAAGLAHVLYAKSPDGVIASARRTVSFRPEIDRAADAAGVDPDLMEAMLFLESGGRTQVIAGDDPEAAAGLAQILAETGSNLLGMRVDLARSRKLTARIAATRRRYDRIPDRIARLHARVDRLSKERDRATPSKRKHGAARSSRAKERRRAARKRRLEAKERRLERKIDRLRELRPKLPSRLRGLHDERARVDERFDPKGAIGGMARYLAIAEERFGRSDLAVASYHMGIGNLESVIGAYVGGDREEGPVAELVGREQLSYAKLFFDSSPLRHPAAWEILGGLGDDSSTYLWRVLSARAILRLYRGDRDRLRRLIELHGAKATAEEVFHPEEDTRTFADPDELAGAYDDGDLVAIPRDRELGFRIGPQLGELADEVGAERSLYRGLRPEALATLIYMATRVRAISGHEREWLIVSSAVRDRSYQQLLLQSNPEATPNYSLHTTGWSFDIRRRYGSDAQASAFQFTLDRLRALGVIDYAVEPAAIHVTVSSRAAPLVDR